MRGCARRSSSRPSWARLSATTTTIAPRSIQRRLRALYRVLQEALNNVARHSGATQAWVRLRFLAETLELEVEDHGVGFSGRPAKQGIGLVAMRERSELLGGKILFSVPAAGGTMLHLTVPRERVEAREKD